VKVSICAAAVVITALTAMGGDKSAAGSVEGDWAPVKAELAGQPMPETVLKTIQLNLYKGKYNVLVAGQPDKGTYSLDVSTKPKSMDIKGTEGPNTGRSFPAIYELEGETLRICYDLSGKQRPAEFKSLPGTRLYLVTYKRKTD